MPHMRPENVTERPTAPPVNMTPFANFRSRQANNTSSSNRSEAQENSDDPLQRSNGNGPRRLPNVSNNEDSDNVQPHIPLHLRHPRANNARPAAQTEGRDGNAGRASERNRAIKAFRSRYEKVRFTGKYNEDFEEHLEDFVDMCNDYDVPESDRIYFLKFSLRHGARQHYKRIVTDKSRFEEVCRLFRSRYAADTKKEQISSRLRSLTINDCRTEDGDDHAALDSLLERINALIPMAQERDRDEESLVFFLKEAVYGTDWGMRATARLGKGHSYQDLVDALKLSQIEVEKNREAAAKMTGKEGDGYRKSLWKHKSETGTEVINDGPKDTLFTGQGRFAHDPKTFSRDKRSRDGKTRGEPRGASKCFNCERVGCALSRCREPKVQDRIAKNLAAWRKVRGIEKGIASINFTCMTEITADELKEVMVSERFLAEATSMHSNEESSESEDDEEARKVMHLRLVSRADNEGDRTDGSDF